MYERTVREIQTFYCQTQR